MSNELVQAVLEIIFSKFMLYLAPMIFLFFVLLFADRMIDIVFHSVINKRRWR